MLHISLFCFQDISSSRMCEVATFSFILFSCRAVTSFLPLLCLICSSLISFSSVSECLCSFSLSGNRRKTDWKKTSSTQTFEPFENTSLVDVLNATIAKVVWYSLLVCFLYKISKADHHEEVSPWIRMTHLRVVCVFPLDVIHCSPYLTCIFFYIWRFWTYRRWFVSKA